MCSSVKKFNQLSDDIKIFIVLLLWSESLAVEGTKVGPKMEIRGAKISIRVDFRVIPSHIIDINAYMLMCINKLTEITKFADQI